MKSMSAQTGNRTALLHWNPITGVCEYVADPHELASGSAPGTYERKTLYTYDATGNRTDVDESDASYNFVSWDYGTADSLNRYGDLDNENIGAASTYEFDLAYDSDRNLVEIDAFDHTADGEPPAVRGFVRVSCTQSCT